MTSIEDEKAGMVEVKPRRQLTVKRTSPAVQVSQDEAAVLSICEFGRTKKEISDESGFSVAKRNRLIASLEEKGILLRSEMRTHDGGRKFTIYTAQPIPRVVKEIRRC